MATVVVNSVADRDVDEILDLIGKAAGATSAARFNRKTDAFFVRLMSFPESGALRPSLGSSVRIGVIHPYLVVYRYDAPNDLVEILRVLHGRRDLKPKASAALTVVAPDSSSRLRREPRTVI